MNMDGGQTTWEQRIYFPTYEIPYKILMRWQLLNREEH